MTEDIETVFNKWKEVMGHARARLDEKRRKAIRSMLAAGYTVEDLELAIHGCSVSPFHQGQNDRAQKYQDIALICRDAEHVDKFIAIAEQARRKRERPEKISAPVSAVPDNIMRIVRRRESLG